MNPQLDDLTVKIPVDVNNMLEDWRWCLNDIKQVLLISKMGDVFCVKNDGGVYWLATDHGALSKIADDVKSFEELLNNDDNIDNWFLPLLVEELAIAGQLLDKDQVYSFKKLPVIGGEYTVDNIEPTDISIHFAVTGQICEKIRNLPDGTK